MSDYKPTFSLGPPLTLPTEKRFNRFINVSGENLPLGPDKVIRKTNDLSLFFDMLRSGQLPELLKLVRESNVL